VHFFFELGACTGQTTYRQARKARAVLEPIRTTIQW